MVNNFALWSDNPSSVDLLAFSAVAETVASALLDDGLDPVVLGVSGRWGSGKTTVLHLVRAVLTKLDNEDARILVVSTDPWRYDPTVGVKESLISEVLSALEGEVRKNKPGGESSQELLGRLAGRVDWAKALTIAAKSSLLLQIPSLDDLSSLVRRPEDSSGQQSRELGAFREDFERLMGTPGLSHITRVVVLVDDLDRCLPQTVIETLEGIRLFLAVPKMSFVIAADEDRIADAIRVRYERTDESSERPKPDLEEEPAKLYLHKIVHTTVPVPALSRFDTEAYLMLLQAQPKVDEETLTTLVNRCDLLRRESKGLEELKLEQETKLSKERALAERLTPILYEKLRGNPRRVKRFLNDIRVRQSVAAKRGIALDTEVVAKMMILEQLLPDEFERLLGWLANGTLRQEVDQLEEAAGRPRPEVVASANIDPAASDASISAVGNASHGGFTDALIRWARLIPSLRDKDLSAYLNLAASFTGQPILDRELPDRLQDIAANLTSRSRADQRSVADAILRDLPSEDAKLLLQHLGRMVRDRPNDQMGIVNSLLRVTRQHQSLGGEVCALLSVIPADEINPSTVLLFGPEDTELHPALRRWRSQAKRPDTGRAVDEILGKENQ